MKPMLATLAERVPTGPEWVHEVKWDGMRVLADVRALVDLERQRRGRVEHLQLADRDLDLAGGKVGAALNDLEGRDLVRKLARLLGSVALRDGLS